MHKARFIPVLIATLLAAASLVTAQQSSKPLTNEDIVSMVKNFLPESVIISAIKTNDTNFDVSANALIALKKAGVTAKVMEAMLAAANNKKNAARTPAPAVPASVAPGAAGGAANAAGSANNEVAATAATPAAGAGVPAGAVPAWQPTASFLQGGSKLTLVAEATQIVQTKSKANSLSALAADEALNEALRLGTEAAQRAVANTGSAIGSSALTSGTNVLSGIMHRRPRQNKVTYVWALQGAGSTASSGSNPPSFEVNYASIPGVNSEAFEPVLLKLAPTQSNFRLVGATEASANVEQGTQQDWPVYSSFIEDRIAAKVQKLGAGHAQVTAAAAMIPGEYAVALRPIDKSKKFSGEDVAKNQREGLLFNYAWSFSIK